MDNKLLRTLPKVDELMRTPCLAALSEELSPVTVTDSVRAELDLLRHEVREQKLSTLPGRDALCARIAARARNDVLPSLRPVLNATGVVLHTNLGRACLSQRAAAAAAAAAQNYSTLEYDIKTGSRGTRYTHVETLLSRLTGAESALVVNNNAAAVLLILSALAQGGEVITSRGELVEIGGSFRVPDIMEACGCRLREVGTTNKTHLSDYERAVTEQTRALLKVHTSNYRIVGFTETIELPDMVALGHEKGLPVIEDLGSGCLLPLERFGLRGEPIVQDSVRAGVDVISFSGDKLLGGPQAGIIVGKKEYVDRLKRHPLTRAMRVDKMTLAALESTLRSYAEGSAETEIPTLRMLSESSEQIRVRAQRLCALLTERGIRSEVVPEEDQVGGGSVPTQLLPTWCVSVSSRLAPDSLAERLRLRAVPVIARIAHDHILLDARTLFDRDLEKLADAVEESCK